MQKVVKYAKNINISMFTWVNICIKETDIFIMVNFLNKSIFIIKIENNNLLSIQLYHLFIINYEQSK